jgi:hypothetical protein
MKQSETVKRIFEHRFPGWLGALVVLAVIVGIKLMMW